MIITFLLQLLLPAYNLIIPGFLFLKLPLAGVINCSNESHTIKLRFASNVPVINRGR